MQAAVKRLDWKALALLISAAGVILHDYYYRVHDGLYYSQPTLIQRIYMHTAIIQGTVDPHYRYRVLAPFMAEGIFKLISLVNPAMAGVDVFKLTYIIHDFLAISFSLCMLYLFLKVWFPSAQALAGSLLVAALMPIALQDHFYQPWSLLEPGFYALALLLAYRKQLAWFGVVVLLTTLNRETAIFLALLFPATNLDFISIVRRKTKIPFKTILASLVYVLIWLIVLGTLRLVRGGGPTTETLATIWAANMWSVNANKALINVPLFMGFGWLLAILGIRHAPLFLRKSLLVVPFLLASVILFGIWVEVRLLMPLYPILAALILCSLYPPPQPPPPNGTDAIQVGEVNDP